jgi:hypothetical protein
MATKQIRRARQGSPVVYQLIERMSSDEKRYFKIFAQKYDKGDGNLCLLLFNAVNKAVAKGHVITDQSVRAQLKGLAVETYFVSAKNKLKNMICDALYEMQSRHMEEFEIMKDMGIAGILHDKGLTGEGNKLLKQTMDTAFKKEYFTLWLEGFRHTINYGVNNISADFDLLHRLSRQSREVVHLLDDYTQQVFNNRLTFNAYLVANEKIDTATAKIFNEKFLVKNAAQAKSAYARYLALNGLVFYYDKQKQRAEVNSIALQQKNILQSTLPNTKRYIGEFFVAYQNYLNSLDPGKAARLIIDGSRDMEKMAQEYLVKGRNKKVGILAICNATIMRLNVFIENNYTLELKSEVPHAVQVHKQIKDVLGNAHEVVLVSLIKDSLFVAGKNADAMKWIKYLKALIPAGLMNHYKLCNQFTELMILIDTGASVKALRNSEENLRLSIGRFNYTAAQQQALLALLKLVSTVHTARNSKEMNAYLNAVVDFVVTIRKSTDGTLRSLVVESNVAWWAQKRVRQ